MIVKLFNARFNVLRDSAGENKSINVFALRKVKKKARTKLRSTYVGWQSKGRWGYRWCVTCDMSRDRDDDRKAMLLLENAGSRAFVNAEIDE